MKLGLDKEIPSENVRPETYTPKTALGRRLIAIREKIIASGAPLLGWAEIEKEITYRRGGRENDDL